MFEAKLTIQIDAPALAQAINNLAAALCGAKPQAPVSQQATSAPAPAPQMVPAAAPPQAPAPVPQQTQMGYPQQTLPGPAPVNTSAPAGFPAPNAGVPLAQPPQYTVDQIMAAGATLMDAGRVNDLMALLHSFGVQAVTDLKPEQMGAFATALRGLGAKI